jgi:hypothetical protein
MIAPFPAPGGAMMTAREAAFDGQARPAPFDRQLFRSQAVEVTADDLRKGHRDPLVDHIVASISIGPEGAGIGYCLLRGFASLLPIEATRAMSAELLGEVWAQFRARSTRIADSREFFTAESLTRDGEIPIELFGSRWTFKPPHADRNGVIFAHVYGPATGFEGGDVLLIDALAYAQSRKLGFDDVCVWSDDAGPQKPVLRADHVPRALADFGRRLSGLGPDEILFVNNAPEGIFHGATEIEPLRGADVSRVLHRCVARERDID